MSDGMNYAPRGKKAAVVKPGEFVFSAAALDHGHIYGMCNGLIEAGGTLKSVWDPDPEKVEQFIKTYPGTAAARSEEEILEDKETALVAGAAVTSERCALGLRVMSSGKDYFTDKAPLTSLAQLEEAKAKVKETGKKYYCYFSERLHVESAVYAGELIAGGAIGRVIQVLGLGPHRVGPPSARPGWFFKKAQYGGILCDIGSHQIEQYLYYAGVKDATVLQSQVGNFGHPGFPELEDYGDAALAGDNGAVNYFRVDWFTPDGLRTWGDGRAFILGTEGYIELRKFINVGTSETGNQLFLANHQGEQHIDCNGKVGYPFFGEFILDCLERTERSMTQEHVFKAAELAVKAQMQARRITEAP
jgi:predicted dehydrogenase